MKFNKKKLGHWGVLVLATTFSAIGSLFRKIGIIKNTKMVAFYGHVLNGNLLEFFDYLKNEGEFKPVYISMFPSYTNSLRKNGYDALTSSSFFDSMKIASVSAFITDHGTPMLNKIFGWSGVKFFDVWHGVPYKGWAKDAFAEQKTYDEVWTSSKYFVDTYRKMGLLDNCIATGYARTDALINNKYPRESLLKKYGITVKNKYIILVAPTWKHDSKNRSIIPFNEELTTFFSKLNKIGKDTGSLIIFRAHLNSGDTIDMKKFKNVLVMPYAKYVNAEEFLGASDVVITDWSSIAFDFLAVKKPVVYIDAKPPFEEGFTLDGSYRFGPVAGNMSDLEKYISKYVGNTAKYRQDYKEVIDKSMEVAYGNLADGKASKRYLERLKKSLRTHKEKT